MRDELHLMELVDRYLDGGMGEAERGAFEERMRANAELRGLLDDQRALREGLHRVRLRGALASAHRRWTMRRWLPWAVAALLVMVMGAWMMMNASGEHGTRSDPGKETAGPSATVGSPAPMAPEGDTLRTTDELVTRVESVFVRSAPRPGMAHDTCVGEGRVVTRLITQEGRHPAVEEISPPQRVDHPDQKDVDTISSGPITLFGDEDRRSDRVRADPSVTDRPEQKELLARVERLQNASKPVFPGGMEEMQHFIDSHIKQPRGYRDGGMVTVGFTVNKKGEVTNVEVVRGLGRAFDAEAVRVVSSMPAWEPSRLGDRPVKSHVEVPVRFPGKVKKERPGGTGRERSGNSAE